MSVKNKKKKIFSIYKLLGIIGDILFIPIIIFALSSCVFMLVQRRKNMPVSLFGNSLVYVMSRSMESEGLLKGDTLFVKEASTQDINLKDVIAFYYYSDAVNDNNNTKHLVKKFPYSGGLYVDMSEEKIEYGVNISDYPKVERQGLKTIKDAQKSNTPIYFHRVIGIYVDDYGNVFYQTKGSDNGSADGYIRSDFVVGKYVETPRAFRDVMTFCGSARGMIILVCIPLSLLVLFQCFSLIKQIEIIGYEKSLIKGKKRFDDEEVKKNFNGNDMELHNKVYLYYIASSEDKQNVKEFMWGNLLLTNKPSKAEKNELATLNSAEEKLKTSKRQYWNEWIQATKGFTRKKIKQYYEELSVRDVLKNNVQKVEDPKPVKKIAISTSNVNGSNSKVDMENEINTIIEKEKAKISCATKERETKVKTLEEIENASDKQKQIKNTSKSNVVSKDVEKTIKSATKPQEQINAEMASAKSVNNESSVGNNKRVSATKTQEEKTKTKPKKSDVTKPPKEITKQTAIKITKKELIGEEGAKKATYTKLPPKITKVVKEIKNDTVVNKVGAPKKEDTQSVVITKKTNNENKPKSPVKTTTKKSEKSGTKTIKEENLVAIENKTKGEAVRKLTTKSNVLTEKSKGTTESKVTKRKITKK